MCEKAEYNGGRWAALAAVGILLALCLALAGSGIAAAGKGLSAAPAGENEWTPLGGPVIEGGQVNALGVHPAISDTVYAAVAPVDAYDTGPSIIYATTDGADSWNSVYVAEHQVYALAVTGTRIYAGAFNPGGPGGQGASIYASHDSGLNWTPVFSITGRGVWLDMAVHPTDTDVAIAGGWVRPNGSDRDQGVVYRTGDGGLNWSPLLTVSIPAEDSAVNAVLMHPFTPTLVLVAARLGDSSDSVIYRSEDGGVTWPTSSTISGAHVRSLAAHASDPQMLYAGTGESEWTWGPSKVFRSTDAGLTWPEVSSAAGGLLVFAPPGTVYALEPPLWASTANGDPGTWGIFEGFWPGPQISFDIDVGTTPANLYVGGGWSGVEKGTDGGTEWTVANNGLETPVTAVDIEVDPHNLDKMFVAADCGGGGWMTDDGGGTWMEPSGIRHCMQSFAVNPQDPDIVYASRGSPTEGSVLRSEDGGLTFETVYTATYILPNGSGGQQWLEDVSIAPSRTDTVYAAGHDSPASEDNQAVILRSLNDGASWTEVFTLPARSSVETLAINPADDEIVYAGGEDCSGPDCMGFVCRTTDGGETWNPTLVTTHTVTSIVIDHWNPNVVYVGDYGYWIRKSTDGGDTWSVVREPWGVSGEPSGYLLAIDPNVPSHVYLGGWGYIAETTDGGATWSEWGDSINQGTPEMDPSALTVDTGTVTQTLYAGFTGVWAHSRAAPQPLRVYLPLVLKQY